MKGHKGFCIALILAVVCLGGCSTFNKQNIILSETEQYYFIPAGTPFKAVIVKGEEPIEVTRDKNTWAVDAGYLVKLQEKANENVLGID